jgi:hypothetical protein
MAHWISTFREETRKWRNSTDTALQNGRSILGAMVNEQIAGDKETEAKSKALLGSWGNRVIDKLLASGLDQSEVMKGLGALEAHAFHHDTNLQDMSELSSELLNIFREDNLDVKLVGCKDDDACLKSLGSGWSTCAEDKHHATWGCSGESEEYSAQIQRCCRKACGVCEGGPGETDATSTMLAIASDMQDTFKRLQALGDKTDSAVQHEGQILTNMKETLKQRMQELSSAYAYQPSSLEEVGLLKETQRLQDERAKLHVRHVDAGSRIKVLLHKFAALPPV